MAQEALSNTNVSSHILEVEDELSAGLASSRASLWLAVGHLLLVPYKACALHLSASSPPLIVI